MDTHASISLCLDLEIGMAIETSVALQASRCDNNAPLIFIHAVSGARIIMQGCCNSWHCARCGQMRARAEYGRMVHGARVLAETHEQYFVTITCKGKSLSRQDALKNYAMWTNRLLTSCRAKASRAGHFWAYVQVTELQKRGFPHSHMLTTWRPDDAIEYTKGDRLPNGRIAKRDCLWSNWFRDANVKAGLGIECDISIVRSPVAVATYIAKYLFKDLQVTEFPPNWRRIRYSRNYPTLPAVENIDAYPLLNDKNWHDAAKDAPVIRCIGELAYKVSKASIKSDTLLVMVN